jgi:hypothetical protein
VTFQLRFARLRAGPITAATMRMLRGVRYSNRSPVPRRIPVSASLAPSPADTARDRWSRRIDELRASLAGECLKGLCERRCRNVGGKCRGFKGLG